MCGKHVCSCRNDNCKCEQSNCHCACNCHDGFVRRFATKAEMIEELSYYLDDLKKEVLAVEERIADLKK